MKTKFLPLQFLLVLLLGMTVRTSAQTTYVKDVMVIGSSVYSEVASLRDYYVSEGWTFIDSDLNAGCGSGSYWIYLLYKSETSPGINKGYITDFYITNASNPVDDSLVAANGHTYYITPYVGNEHFEEIKGDLNCGVGGSDDIHLYYTKEQFADNRAVTNIWFNNIKAGGVGLNGDNSEGYDLNKGCGPLSDYIYMHISTAAAVTEFTSGNLIYAVNPDYTTLTVKGHVNGTGAAGPLTLPASVSYGGADFTVTAIGANAFQNCHGLTDTLAIPNTVTTIGDYAFFSCYNLNGSLTIPNSVTSIGTAAFYNCHGFTGSLTLPNSVTSIGNYAFSYCYGFTGSLTIPNSLTTIGNTAFSACSGFDALTIPNSVTTIGAGAFSFCYGFVGDLTLPNSVTSIGINAFCDCTGFSGTLTLPSSLTTIENTAFENCYGFMDIVSNATTPPTLGSNAFSGWDKTNTPVTVPFGCGSAYSSITWGGFSNFIDLYTIHPTNLVEADNTVFNDEQIIISWTAVTDPTLQKYKVYRDGEWIGETTATSYTDGPLAYNMSGYTYYVTAVYTAGESVPSNTVSVQVSGYGFISGQVYGQDGVTGIADATVTLTGTDEFGGSHTYNFTTNSSGYYLQQFYVGSYNGQATRDGYQTTSAPVQGNPVVIQYNQTTSSINFLLVPVPINQTTTLAQGWSWWSTYIEQSGINGLAMLENSVGTACNRIQSRTEFTDLNCYQGYCIWDGTLNAITNEQSYRIRTTSPCEAVITGQPALPENHPITVNPGWNWIGFPSAQPLSVTSALSAFAPEVNDQIKGRYNFATYLGNYGGVDYWDGMLTTLEPGQGYMYRSYATTAKTLVYQTGSKSELVPNGTTESNYYQPVCEEYAENMTVTAEVELNGSALRRAQGPEFELAAFVGEECRGSVKLRYVAPLDRYEAFLMVFGDGGEELSFVLTDGEETYWSSDRVVFSANAILGNPTEPFVLHFGSTSVSDKLAQSLRVYPNPVERGERFSIGLNDAEERPVRIEMVNALGALVKAEVLSQWPATLVAPATAGVYTLKIVVDDKTVVCRRVVVK